MKIVHVTDCMEIGGAETLVSQLCRLQRQQGHDPGVYAVAALGALGERMRKEGFHVLANIGASLPAAARNFYRLFSAAPPDVVHLHNPTPTIYAALPARLAGVPAIVSTRHSLVAPPHRKLMELKYACAAASCDWVVGICDATANNVKSLRTVAPRKIVRIYNGAEQLVGTPPDDWPRKSGFTLVYVGRLEPVKNHALLLNAFSAALQSMPELRLWMVGDGTERKAMESLAAKLSITSKVTFWGSSSMSRPSSPPPTPSSCPRVRRGCPSRSCRHSHWDFPPSSPTWAAWRRSCVWPVPGSQFRLSILPQWPRPFCASLPPALSARFIPQTPGQLSTSASPCKP